MTLNKLQENPFYANLIIVTKKNYYLCTMYRPKSWRSYSYVTGKKGKKYFLLFV